MCVCVYIRSVVVEDTGRRRSTFTHQSSSLHEQVAMNSVDIHDLNLMSNDIDEELEDVYEGMTYMCVYVKTYECVVRRNM